MSRLARLGQDLAGGGASDLAQGFGYNPASQVVSRMSSNDAYAWTWHYNISRAYQANGLNQYTQSGEVAPSYDLRGNLTSAGPTTYAYSSENRLLSASGAQTAQLSYDPIGRLVRIAGGVATRLGYDGMNLVAEYDDGGNLLRRYVHGPGEDEPLVWYEGAGTGDKRWLHANAQGSIVAVSDSASNARRINAI